MFRIGPFIQTNFASMLGMSSKIKSLPWLWAPKDEISLSRKPDSAPDQMVVISPRLGAASAFFYLLFYRVGGGDAICASSSWHSSLSGPW
jgi:hypothetical protein